MARRRNCLPPRLSSSPFPVGRLFFRCFPDERLALLCPSCRRDSSLDSQQGRWRLPMILGEKATARRQAVGVGSWHGHIDQHNATHLSRLPCYRGATISCSAADRIALTAVVDNCQKFDRMHSLAVASTNCTRQARVVLSYYESLTPTSGLGCSLVYLPVWVRIDPLR